MLLLLVALLRLLMSFLTRLFAILGSWLFLLSRLAALLTSLLVLRPWLFLLSLLATLLSNLFAVFRARLLLYLVPFPFLVALLTHLLAIRGRGLFLFLFALEASLLA